MWLIGCDLTLIKFTDLFTETTEGDGYINCWSRLGDKPFTARQYKLTYKV